MEVPRHSGLTSQCSALMVLHKRLKIYNLCWPSRLQTLARAGSQGYGPLLQTEIEILANELEIFLCWCVHLFRPEQSQAARGEPGCCRLQATGRIHPHALFLIKAGISPGIPTCSIPFMFPNWPFCLINPINNPKGKTEDLKKKKKPKWRLKALP